MLTGERFTAFGAANIQSELTEAAMRQQKVGPYSDPSAAHEKALRLKSKGAKSIRIDKSGDKWWIGFVASKQLGEERLSEGSRPRPDRRAPKKGMGVYRFSVQTGGPAGDPGTDEHLRALLNFVKGKPGHHIHDGKTKTAAKVADVKAVLKVEIAEERLVEGGFKKGQRVSTPSGPGTVAYQRMAPPKYAKPEAVSVVLDKRKGKTSYTGTMFLPADIKVLKEGAETEERLAESMGNGTVETFLHVLSANITQSDMAQEKRDRKRGISPNMHAMGLMMGAADKVRSAVKADLKSDDAKALGRLKKVIERQFTDTPMRKKTLKAIDKFMVSGKPPKYPSSATARGAWESAGEPVASPQLVESRDGFPVAQSIESIMEAVDNFGGKKAKPFTSTDNDGIPGIDPEHRKGKKKKPVKEGEGTLAAQLMEVRLKKLSVKNVLAMTGMLGKKEKDRARSELGMKRPQAEIDKHAREIAIKVASGKVPGWSLSDLDPKVQAEYAKYAPKSESEGVALAAQFMGETEALDESGGHHTKSGDKWYADTAFMNNTSGVLPGFTMAHLGFGEFVLKGPDGEIEFDRMRGKDFKGQSGRSHQVYDNKKGALVKKLMKAMQAKGKSDLVESDLTEAESVMDKENWKQSFTAGWNDAKKAKKEVPPAQAWKSAKGRKWGSDYPRGYGAYTDHKRGAHAQDAVKDAKKLGLTESKTLAAQLMG